MMPCDPASGVRFADGGNQLSPTSTAVRRRVDQVLPQQPSSPSLDHAASGDLPLERGGDLVVVTLINSRASHLLVLHKATGRQVLVRRTHSSDRSAGGYSRRALSCDVGSKSSERKLVVPDPFVRFVDRGLCGR
jgi:hypothetical protein